jgi:hypothetical protein
MERTARVKIFALLFQLYPRIDQIDDVGSGKQIANNTRNCPAIALLFLMTINENKPRIPSEARPYNYNWSELRASLNISTDECGVRFREPVSSRDVSLQKL